jgi:hypothetical protein
VQTREEKGIACGSESSRVITGNGSVLRSFCDGTAQILFANGNVGNRTGDTWTSTNNIGKRRTRTGDLEDELPSVPYSEITDPETMAKTMVREDKVMRM